MLGLDLYNNMEVPPFILCKQNEDRIDIIQCTDKKKSIRFNSFNEITFSTYLYMDGEKNKLYESIKELMIVELPNIGRFVINNVNIHSEGTMFEYKECNAISEETNLAQKHIENFVINNGTTESIDGVKFYNLSNPEKSLLHLVLEKIPDWNIGHIDNKLCSMERCFEVTRQDVYSFLKNDASKAFECIFEFDTIRHLINIYEEKNVGDDTDIHISYQNLANQVDISCSSDDIKTCLVVSGADELNLREVNMGYDRIYNLEYFNNTEYMSENLYVAYNKWKSLWNSKVKDYEKLVTSYQDYYNKIHFLEIEKMPDDPNSTDWKLFGLNPLKEKLAVYEQKQAVMIKAGQAKPDHKDYSSVYLPCFNAINSIKSQISIVEKELNNLKAAQETIRKQMDAIIDLISMKKNFTLSELKELSKFIREDELSSDNYVVTDTMTDSERMTMLHDMLEFGQKELARISVPTMQFTMDMSNIYAIPEFKEETKNFKVGNYIYCTLRDDYHVKLRLLEININFCDINDFSVTFGNISRNKSKNIFEDVTKALELAQSAATSVSFNSSNWNKANKDSTKITEMLTDGLLSSGNRIHTSKSDVVFDDRGMIIKNHPDAQYPNDVIFAGGGQIVFSDDNLKTVKTALGRVSYVKKGVRYDDFGLLAQFVIAGYIGGSVIEGDEIIGGSITGTSFNNGNGTFSVDQNGNLIAKSATVEGNITANEGYIGGKNGFTIKTGKLYSSNKSSFNSTSVGVYLGTDGISLGLNTPFSVDQNGNLIAKSGTIGGAEIGSTYLKSTNGNWQLNNSGYAVFTGAKINGVDVGSRFGSIGYDTTGTWGNFGGNSYYGSLAENPFSGQCVNHIQSISADYIYANYLRAMKADINEIKANYITADYVSARYAKISTVEAAVGRIASIESNYVKTSQLNAVKAEITDLRSKMITTDNLASNIASITSLRVLALNVDGGFVCGTGSVGNWTIKEGFTCLGKSASWKTFTVNGKSYTALCGA